MGVPSLCTRFGDRLDGVRRGLTSDRVGDSHYRLVSVFCLLGSEGPTSDRTVKRVSHRQGFNSTSNYSGHEGTSRLIGSCGGSVIVTITGHSGYYEDSRLVGPGTRIPSWLVRLRGRVVWE